MYNENVLRGRDALTQKKLKELLHYDPDTGVLAWLERSQDSFKSVKKWKRFNTRCAGKVTGTINGKGYIVIRVFGKTWLAHRLAILYMSGEFPEETDHRNGIRNDNRWCNLRASTRKRNARNQRLRSDNTSGAVGVYMPSGSKSWLASIGHEGKTICLGSHADKSHALVARKAAEKVLGYDPRHGCPDKPKYPVPIKKGSPNGKPFQKHLPTKEETKSIRQEIWYG